MLKNILAITGKPGLYKLVSRGNNMLIVESLVDGDSEKTVSTTIRGTYAVQDLLAMMRKGNLLFFSMKENTTLALMKSIDLHTIMAIIDQK